MKRLALLAMSTVFCGCYVRGPGVWFAPPPARVTVEVAPAPPPPQATIVVETQPATAQVEVVPGPEVTVEDEEVVATSEPPELVYEEQDDMPGPGVIWIGGYWHWSGVDWVWYRGGWNRAPEGRLYIEPYYEHVDGHVVYVRGYWGERGAQPRYYGGDRIAFSRPPRPEGYRRGEHRPVPRSAGLPPGHRAGHYGPKPTGPVKKRPLPIATAPRKPVPHQEPGRGEPGRGEPGRGEPGRGEPGRGEPGRAEPGRAEPGRVEGKPEPKPEPKPETKPEPRPEPKPEAKPAPKPEAKPAPKPVPPKKK